MSFPVKEFMIKDVPIIEDYVSVTEAAKVMKEKSRGFLIVLKNKQLAGIITIRDFVNKVIAAEKDPKITSVSEVMSSPLITVDPDEDLFKASEIMHNHNIRRLPVVRDGILYGVLTSGEIARSCSAIVDRATRDIIRWSIVPV